MSFRCIQNWLKTMALGGRAPDPAPPCRQPAAGLPARGHPLSAACAPCSRFKFEFESKKLLSQGSGSAPGAACMAAALSPPSRATLAPPPAPALLPPPQERLRMPGARRRGAGTSSASATLATAELGTSGCHPSRAWPLPLPSTAAAEPAAARAASALLSTVPTPLAPGSLCRWPPPASPSSAQRSLRRCRPFVPPSACPTGAPPFSSVPSIPTAGCPPGSPAAVPPTGTLPCMPFQLAPCRPSRLPSSAAAAATTQLERGPCPSSGSNAAPAPSGRLLGPPLEEHLAAASAAAVLALQSAAAVAFGSVVAGCCVPAAECL